MLDHSAVKHGRWNVTADALLLQNLQAKKHDALLLRQTVSRIR